MRILRRGLPLLAALACLGAAAVLALLAVDARAWQHTLTRDDLRFRAMHSHADLWHSQSVLPGDPARRVLGLGDALGYREALQLFWFSRVGTNPDTRQDVAQTRVLAQERLQGLATGAATGAERSDAANLLGVMTVTTPAADAATQTQTLQRAALYFQRAILDDPTNYAAKLNLELVLRLRRPGKSRFGKDARGGYGYGGAQGAGVIGGGF
jgi:hypothetical protein